MDTYGSRLVSYLNPIKRLGRKEYSVVFPSVVTLLTCIALEFYAYHIAHNPNAAGLLAIFIFIAFIIYFSFRDGIRGGLITSFITIFYYFYLIKTRHYHGAQESSGIDTTIILGVVYVVLATIIGWLKQTIDTLIEREANEKRRLQTILQQLPVGVMITDAQGNVVQTNRAIDSILGGKIPEGFAIAKENYVKSLYNGKPISPSHSPLASVLATGRDILAREITIERADGRQAHLHVSASAIRNKRGKIIAAASIVNDMTDQKEMETRKDDFVNMASHELKTPITSMKLYTDLLARYIATYKDTRANKTIESIINQTERLQELVNDLLDVSRLQTGKLSFTKAPFRLDELIRENVDELQEATKHEIVLQKSLAVTVNADRFRIYQVLTNLITNAIKYSPSAGKIIVRMKKDERFVTVSVQDFGMGIAKAQQSKVFDRLYQVADSETHTFPGFGMGLYIAKEIVSRHRGKIWVESVKDEGSTFSFSLPLK